MPMNKKYDVIIVGAGPAGIFLAYELHIKAPNLQVLLVDKGNAIHQRRCPILEGRVSKCPPATGRKDFAGCLPACSITAGFGGAGAYSDGKFNITSEFGGWMTDYMSASDVEDLIRYVDEINLKHGATVAITDPTTQKVKEIEERGYAVGLKLLRAQVRHLGTEQNLQILTDIYHYLANHIDFAFKTEVENFIVVEGAIKGIVTKNGEIHADTVAIVPGRDGSKWLTDVMNAHKIPMKANQVDIGVRVETSDVVMREINKHLYEGKFIYRTSVGTTVRTFCSNPSGHVVIENHSGIMLANGHSFKDPKLGSKNTNFALLVSHQFDEPFNEPTEFAHDVSRLANRLSNGGIIVQTYGDIIKGRRTTPKRLKEAFIEPTQKTAVPGDLGLVLPYNTMKSLIEMVEALDHVTPGIANEHTLFYGVEAKFYSARPQTNDKFETPITGLYVGGDGAGITRGLAQAGANGIIIARNMIEKLVK